MPRNCRFHDMWHRTELTKKKRKEKTYIDSLERIENKTFLIALNNKITNSYSM